MIGDPNRIVDEELRLAREEAYYAWSRDHGTA